MAEIDSTQPPPARRRHFAWRILRTAVFTYLLVILVLALLQRKLMYHPRTAPSLQVRDFPAVISLFPHAEDLSLLCADNVRIGAWLLKQSPSQPDDPKTRPLVIYFHGNAGDRSTRIGWYTLLKQLNVDVLAIDYHGYGDSGGRISESALEADCDAAWQYATAELGYEPHQIYVVGTSLGGAAAVYLTAKQCERNRPPAAMVTVATFSSMTDAGSSHYPWLPVRYVLVDRYPSDQRIPRVTCPVLLLHGDQDRVVRQEFGEKLFAAAPATSQAGVPKRWVNLPNVGHNDILHLADDTILQEFRALLKSVQDAP